MKPVHVLNDIRYRL